MIYLNFIKYDTDIFTKILYYYPIETKFDYKNSKYKYNKIYSFETIDVVEKWLSKKKFLKNPWNHFFKLSKIDIFNMKRNISSILDIVRNSSFNNDNTEHCIHIILSELDGKEINFQEWCKENMLTKKCDLSKQLQYKEFMKLKTNITNLEKKLLHILNDTDFMQEIILLEIKKSNRENFYDFWRLMI